MQERAAKNCIAVILVICCVFAFFCACDNISGATAKKQDVTVFVEDLQYKFSFSENEIATIKPSATPVKSGYFLKGYYDKRNGGTKYFDCNGKSTTLWNFSYPDVFYAQWVSVDGFTVLDGVKWNGNTFSFSGSRVLSANITEENMDRYSAVAGNLDGKVHITFSFKMSCPPNSGFGNDPNRVVERRIVFQDADDSSAEAFFTKTVELKGLDYNEISFSTECSARVFGKNTFNNSNSLAIFIKLIGSDFYPTYIKDLCLTATFV